MPASTHGCNAEEFVQLVSLGMTPVQALRAGTSVTAELVGLADKIGSLESGKQDIHRVEKVFFVMKEGKIYRNDQP